VDLIGVGDTNSQEAGDDPASGEGHDGRLSVKDDFATKDIDVETALLWE